MLKYGSTVLDNFGVRIKEVRGLFDFPALKKEGNEWSDVNYTQPFNREIDFQYKSRKITIKCYAKADNWSSLYSNLNTIASRLHFGSPPYMLILSDYSVRGYMCYLKHSTILKPTRYYYTGKCVAEFDLIFEEPQPFNAQFTIINNGEIEEYINVSIKSPFRTNSIKSDEQIFVTVYYGDERQEVNLQQEDCLLQFALVPGILFPIIICGETDRVGDVILSIGESNVEVYKTDPSNLFLRNGAIL